MVQTDLINYSLEKISTVNCIRADGSYSLNCVQNQICPQITNYFHLTIINFLVIGFIMFIVCMLMSRYLDVVCYKLFGTEIFYDEYNTLIIINRIFQIYAFSCIIFFIIMLTMGL